MCSSDLVIHAVSIQIGAQDNRPVDIIMVKGKTNFDIRDFEEKLNTALQKYEVDLNRVKMDTTKTYSMDIAEQDPSKILSEWEIAFSPAVWEFKDGQIVDPEYHCRRSGFYNKDVTLQGHIVYECSFKGSDHSYNDYYGITFCMDGTRNYYALIWEDIKGSRCGVYSTYPERQLNSSSSNLQNREQLGLSLLKISDCNCQHGNYCSHARLSAKYDKPWTTNPKMWVPGQRGMGTKFVSHTLKVDIDKGTITVYADGLPRMTYTDPEPYTSGSYGFVSVSHGGGSFYNIKVTSEMSKDLVDVVRAPSWRLESHRFVIDLMDEVREDFDNQFKVGEIVERLKADKAHYLGVGVPDSKNAIQGMVNKLGGSGEYLSHESMNQTQIYDELAKYIAEVVNKRVSKTGAEYLIKNHEYLFDYKEV